MDSIVPAEVIERRIYLIRGQKVMLSMHLAELYGVETRALNQAKKEIFTDSLRILCFR